MSDCSTVRGVSGSPARVEVRSLVGCPHVCGGVDSVARVRRMAVRAVAPAGCLLFGDCV